MSANEFKSFQPKLGDRLRGMLCFRRVDTEQPNTHVSSEHQRITIDDALNNLMFLEIEAKRTGFLRVSSARNMINERTTRQAQKPDDDEQRRRKLMFLAMVDG